VEINTLTECHVSRPPCSSLPALLWNSFLLVEVVQLVKSFSLVSVACHGGGSAGDGGGRAVFMCPLIYSWARNQQNESQQHSSWESVGFIVVLFHSRGGIW